MRWSSRRHSTSFWSVRFNRWSRSGFLRYYIVLNFLIQKTRTWSWFISLSFQKIFKYILLRNRSLFLNKQRIRFWFHSYWLLEFFIYWNLFCFYNLFFLFLNYFRIYLFDFLYSLGDFWFLIQELVFHYIFKSDFGFFYHLLHMLEIINFIYERVLLISLDNNFNGFWKKSIHTLFCKLWFFISLIQYFLISFFIWLIIF